jgi:type I restriction-modification system DNA methylase subunit
LGESEKPLLISGILLALHNPSFKKSYDEEPSNLCTFLYDSISSELDKADIPNVKKENMKSTYYFIKTHDDLVKDKNGDIPLQKIIRDIDKNFDHINDFDSIGEFYKEFLRYTGEDKQGLGIVLTPHHITDLFTELADVTKNNVVLDTCAGTGGYLISAMYKMFIGANDNEKEKIKSEQLIGIEQNMKMFTLMCSNMLLRGDGKANLYRGDSFDNKIIKKIKGKADVGMMNPPYSQKEEGLQEFNFIENLLDCLKVGGKGIVIVPMSCALTTKSYNQMMKEKILKKHRLEAVLSMPDQLFNPIGTITCIMIFTAHVPHTKEHRTWFGYCKDDGFELLKHRGRIDVNNRWHDIKKYWLDAYRNKKEIAGFSVLQHVDVNDEWCAEAYMETDYSFLKVEDFEREIKKYLLFKELGCDISD